MSHKSKFSYAITYFSVQSCYVINVVTFKSAPIQIEILICTIKRRMCSFGCFYNPQNICGRKDDFGVVKSK